MKPVTMLPALLLAALLGTATAPVVVAQEAKPVASVRDFLLSQVGKRVAVRLGDQDIEGTVAAVGADTVQLSKVTGKDFYDAVVSISKINAVIYKAR